MLVVRGSEAGGSFGLAVAAEIAARADLIAVAIA